MAILIVTGHIGPESVQRRVGPRAARQGRARAPVSASCVGVAALLFRYLDEVEERIRKIDELQPRGVVTWPRCGVVLDALARVETHPSTSAERRGQHVVTPPSDAQTTG